MFARLFLLILVVPIVELTLLVQIGGVIGFWPTVALVVLTALAGSFFIRHEGFSTWKRLNQKLATGSLPGDELLDGVIILVAGILLLTPGFLTDVVGVAGLFPPTRTWIRKKALQKLRPIMVGGMHDVSGGVFGASPFEATNPSEKPPGTSEWGGTPRSRPAYAEQPPDDKEG
jgi:UPF0716 protein FxsA